AFLVLLVAGGAVTAWQAVRLARAERDQAVGQARRSREVHDALGRAAVLRRQAPAAGGLGKGAAARRLARPAEALGEAGRGGGGTGAGGGPCGRAPGGSARRGGGSWGGTRRCSGRGRRPWRCWARRCGGPGCRGRQRHSCGRLRSGTRATSGSTTTWPCTC